MRRLFGMLYQVKLYILIKHNVYTMKGFVIKIELYGRKPEISRKLIIPEKTTFMELQKIIKKLFTFSDKPGNGFWTNTALLSYIDPKNFLVEKYIHQNLYFEDGYSDEKWYEISLKNIIDYDESYAKITDYCGDFNIKKAQEELRKIPILKNKAYDIIIKSKKTAECIEREFLIPEKTSFNELEEIILIAFDTKPVSFKKDFVMVDECFKKPVKITSENNEFIIEVKKKIYSKINFPLLIDYKGGRNPFDLWWEYYPKVPDDENQSMLDDFYYCNNFKCMSL